MEITLTKKFKENYGKNKELDTNQFKLKPLRMFGGRPKKEVEIKNKKLKSYINIRKDGFYKLDFK
tara:strand:+ start:363 stop:557 length:195 start_codon:yes stop_codon:yes gene_type:complete